MPLRTVSNTGGNWNATTTWTGGVVPIAGDTVDFTATSGPVTVNVATANLAGINFTNYVNTITFTNSIFTSGTVNLGTGGYTQAGAGGLNIMSTATLTSNGVVWSRSLTFSGNSITYTLADSWTVSGGVFLSGTVSSVINSNTLNISGNLTVTTTAVVSGTTSFVFNGTGTWSHTSTGSIRNNLTINTASTLTVSGTVYYNTGTLTYTAGTVITAGSTLACNASTTFNTSSINWDNVTFYTTGLVATLTSNFNVTGVFTLSYTSTATVSFSVGANLFNLTGSLVANVGTNGVTLTLPHNLIITNATLGNAAGTFTINSNSLSVTGNLTVQSVILGTTTIVLAGTGTWSGNANGQVRNNTTINTPGTLTLSGTINYNTGTLTYTGGTVITTGSTLAVGATTTLNTNGIIWNNVSFANGAIIITLSSNLTALGNLTVNVPGSGNMTINGSTFYIGGDLSLYGSAGNTYSILGTTLFVLNGTGTWSMILNALRVEVDLNIDTTGTITISGTVFYKTKTLTYVNGTVDSSNGTLYIDAFGAGTTTLNTGGMTWSRVFMQNTLTIVLLSDLNIDNFLVGYFANAAVTPVVTSVTFSGAYKLTVNDTLSIGSGRYSLASNASSDSTLNLPTPITVKTLNVRLSGGRNTSFTSIAYNALINNHSVTVLDTISIIVNDLASASISATPIFGGTSELIMKGSTWVTTGSSLAGVLGTSGNAYNYVFPITIDTGFLTISNNIILSPRFIYNTSYTFKHVAGTVKTTMPLQLGTGPTLINMQNIPWSDVFIASGITVTMNQFFGGSALKRTKVQATSTTNYNISFQDQFEKVCKFLEISNCTVSRRGQLLSLTDVRQKGTNLGIRYYNQSPNGVSKNGSLTQPSMTFDTGGLLPDPNCVKLN